MKTVEMLKRYEVGEFIRKDELIYEGKKYPVSHGYVFRYCRAKLGMKQKEMAGHMKLNQSAISRIEYGRRLPTKIQIEKLEELMQKTYREILEVLSIKKQSC